jgi:hypothetical protein
MKKIILLSCFSIFLLSGLLGQEVDFKYKVDSTKSTNQTYSISIEIIKGNGPYTLYLFQGEPWKGGIEIQKINSGFSKTYKFQNLTKGTYYFIVQSGNEDITSGKTIKIK